MAKLPSDEWFAIYVDRINGSSDYREAAADWEGDVAFVFEAEPDKGFPDEVWAWLDLWHGACRAGRIVPREEGERARFVIRAPYSRWKQIVQRDLDPIKGMMQGKLRVQGDLPTIVRYARAANELVGLAATIPTEFADEVRP